MVSRICRIGGGALAAALILSGCTTLHHIFVGSRGQVVCPTAAILADTASFTVFRNNLQNDPAGALYSVNLDNVKTDCTLDRRNGISDSSLSLSFHARRSPNGNAATYTVPYFVAITQVDHILSKRLLNVQFSFAPGAAYASFEESVDSTEIKLQNGKQPYDYEILVGLQVTPAQRDYNKKMGRFAQ